MAEYYCGYTKDFRWSILLTKKYAVFWGIDTAYTKQYAVFSGVDTKGYW